MGISANNLLNDPALLDPVSKLRVSNPQSMIDTDFEYSIQTTKWEYLLTVNNIPSYYIKPGAKNPLPVTSFAIVQGSLLATVTAPASGVVQGMPIEIVGLADYSLDGIYAVRKILTVNSFIVRLRLPAKTSGEQVTPYTICNTGGVMTGSFIGLSNTWSAANSSTFYVQTVGDHGLTTNNSVTLLNTVNFVPKLIDAANAFKNSVYYVNSIPISNTSPGEYSAVAASLMGNNFLTSQIIPYNWMSANVITLPGTAMNVNSNVYTTYGHGIDDIDTYAMFVMTPPYASNLFGSANLVASTGAVYYANASNTNYFTLRTTRYNALTNCSPFSNVTTNSTFPFLLMKNVVEVSNISTTGIITLASNHNCNVYDNIVFANLASNTFTGAPVVRVSNNLIGTNYYSVFPLTNNTMYISNLNNLPITSFGAGFTQGGSNLFMIQLNRNFPEYNSVYFPNHGLISNQSVLFQGNTSFVANTVIGARDNTAYFVDVVSPNRIRLKQNLVSVSNTLDFLDASNSTVVINTYTLSNTQCVYQPNHSLLNNDQLVYYANLPNQSLLGLTNFTTYYAKYLTPNSFRLSPDQREVTLTSLTRAAGSNVCTLGYSLNANDTAYSPGDNVFITLNSGEYPDIGGFYNVTSVTNTAITVNLPFGSTVTDSISLTLANCTSYKVSYLSGNTTPGNVQTFINQSTIDGYYQINYINSNTFSINIGSNINDKYLYFDASNIYSCNLLYNSITYPGHSMADGTPMYYSNLGNPSLIGFNNGQIYYAMIRDANTFSISDTKANALSQSFVKPLGVNRTGFHAFWSNNMIGSVPITGQYQSTSYGLSNTSAGYQTRLTTNFVNGKRINVINSAQSLSTPYIVTNVYSDFSASVTPTTPSTMTGNTIMIPMSVIVEPSGYVLHRPFDGGVMLTTGTDSMQSLVRQTRTYFRYQAGKGVQMSAGINFNPPQDCDFAFSVDPQTIQVQSSKPHGFSFPFGSNVILSGTTGFVNGTFPLSLVIDPYNFQLKTSNNGAGTVSGQIITLDAASQSNVAIGAYPVGSNVYIQGNTATIIANTLTTLTFAQTSNLYGVTGSQSFFVAPVLTSNAGGYPRYNVQTPSNATVRAGMYDSQNGMFFECASGIMNCVRRNSIQQIGGIVSMTYGSSVVIGTNTNFTRQLGNSNSIVIRGMTYIVNNIASDTQMTIVPAYRGISANNVIVSKTLEVRVPQSQWSLDHCDGTGPSGYNLDITKMQMVYIDFAWYGAGKIRFGFKNQYGKVFYVHEITNANLQNVAYLRSGNLPARYELRNDGPVFFQPYLFHWGTSVIIDGTFTDDKNYYFTGDSDILTFTNGISSNLFGTTAAGTLSITGIPSSNLLYIKNNFIITGTGNFKNNAFSTNTKITAAYPDPNSSNLFVQINKPALLTLGNSLFNLPGGNPIYQLAPIPVLSVRLGPSTDSGITGTIGSRDLLTRMQLVMKSVDATVTHETQVQIFLNCDFSSIIWTSVYSPSLAQYYRHQVGDVIRNGIQLISFRAQGGNLGTAASNLARSVNTTTLALDTLAILSNSIYGGDGVYPNGPDTITVCMTPIETSTINAISPYQCACRLSWVETQA